MKKLSRVLLGGFALILAGCCGMDTSSYTPSDCTKNNCTQCSSNKGNSCGYGADYYGWY